MTFLTEIYFNDNEQNVLIHVIQCVYSPPNYRADNDWDYYGGFDVEFECLLDGVDITCDLSECDYARIENEVIDYCKGQYED